jgi:hypothetical protein
MTTVFGTFSLSNFSAHNKNKFQHFLSLLFEKRDFELFSKYKIYCYLKIRSGFGPKGLDPALALVT